MAVAEARGRWLEENKAQMDALDTSIRNMVREATTEHEKVINRHLSRLIRLYATKLGRRVRIFVTG